MTDAQDLVEQLREEADDWQSVGDTAESAMLREAAAEIERLRAAHDEVLGALRRITHEHLQFTAYYEPSDYAVQREGRAAIAKAESKENT